VCAVGAVRRNPVSIGFHSRGPFTRLIEPPKCIDIANKPLEEEEEEDNKNKHFLLLVPNPISFEKPYGGI
jgi:hypothetical protein